MSIGGVSLLGLGAMAVGSGDEAVSRPEGTRGVASSPPAKWSVGAL